MTIYYTMKQVTSSIIVCILDNIISKFIGIYFYVFEIRRVKRYKCNDLGKFSESGWETRINIDTRQRERRV